MDKFRMGVKAFIVKDGKFLFIKRRGDDSHNPNQWDLPGGRVEPEEDPHAGLIREAKEETELEIEIVLPLHVDHFQKQDGQLITLIHFLCKAINSEIKLSDEHQEYKWVDLAHPNEEIPTWLTPVLANYHKYERGLSDD